MRRLAVFARPPVDGEVKTRLSPALPPALARSLYAGMLADTLATAARGKVDERTVFWAGEPARAPVALPAGFLEHAQAVGDLGTRMREAFGVMLDAQGAKAVIIGTDCPDLDEAVLERAFEALDTVDLVLGPASDGGYYLIGLTRLVPELFSGIDWSTAAVFEQTMAAAATAGLSSGTVDVLADIDTAGDLARWIGHRAANGAATAQETRGALVRMGLLPA